MKLTQLVYLGARCFFLSVLFVGITTRSSRAQPIPDLNFLHFDPLDDFEELRIEPIQPISRTLAECLTNPQATFAITQRGGLADDPLQGLRDRTLWTDLRPLEDTELALQELPQDDPSQPVNTELSGIEDPELSNLQICQTLFDNQ